MNIDAFDPSPYQRCPQAPIQATMLLGRVLAELAPAPAPDLVAKNAGELLELVGVGEAALTQRRRALGPARLAYERACDDGSDLLWNLFVAQLQLWAAWSDPALATSFAGDASEAAATLKQKRDRAEAAAKLLVRVFGDQGLAFTDADPSVQSESMAALLRLIDADELEPALAELIDPDLLPMLRAMQGKYEAMVAARLSRSQGPAVDLRQLRIQLQRAIVRYAGVVLGMYDPKQPETRATVEAALRPVVIMRAMIASRSRDRMPPAKETLGEAFEELDDVEASFAAELEAALAGEDEGEAEGEAEDAQG